jgi:hypothetical protein
MSAEGERREDVFAAFSRWLGSDDAPRLVDRLSDADDWLLEHRSGPLTRIDARDLRAYLLSQPTPEAQEDVLRAVLAFALFLDDEGWGETLLDALRALRPGWFALAAENESAAPLTLT